jgi:hypothetical protein
MEQTIKIEVRSNYGSESVYITSEHSGPISALTKKKTVNLSELKALKQLGFTIKPGNEVTIFATENLIKENKL